MTTSACSTDNVPPQTSRFEASSVKAPPGLIVTLLWGPLPTRSNTPETFTLSATIGPNELSRPPGLMLRSAAVTPGAVKSPATSRLPRLIG